MTGPVIIEESKYFHDEMKKTDKCAFCEGWLWNFKEPTPEGYIQIEYPD
jgi:hypothetical protein